MLPSSDFQVASSEVNRLPTLKELIGYQTNEYTSSPSPIFLSLFPLKAKDEEILSHEKNTNRILEATTVRDDTIFDVEPTTLVPNKHDEKEETGYAIQNDLDLSVDSIDTYYVEDNIAIDENDISLTNKKRIDRQDSSTTVTLKPTTMRGIPLVNLLQSQVPRGFYVTRSETEHPIQQEQVRNDESTTEWTTLSIENKENASSKIANEIEQRNPDRTIVTDFNHNDSEENSKSSTQVITTLKPDFSTKGNEIKDRDESTAPSTNRVQTEKDIDLFTEIPSLETNAAPSISIPVISLTDSPVTFTSLSSNEPESIVSTTSESLTNDDATLSIKNTDSTLTSVTEIQSNFTTKTNILESVTETGLHVENGTHAANLQENYSTDEKVSSIQQTGEARRNVVKDGEESKLSSLLSTTTRPSTQSERSANKFNRRRQRIEFNPNHEFGRKSQDGRQNHRYVSPSNEDQKDSIKETRRTQHPRRRVISYRGRHRRPFVTGTAVNDSFASNTTTRTTNRTVNDDDKLKATKKSAKEEFEQIEAITGSTKRTKAGNSVENRNDGANKEETSVEKKVVPKANLTGKEAISKEERLRIEENIGRSESEVSLDFKFPTLATCDDIKKEV